MSGWCSCDLLITAPSHTYFTAGNESCPQPQTSEHLAAIEIMKLKHIIILQNKIDLVRDTQAKDQQQEILKFVQGTAGPQPLWYVLSLVSFADSYLMPTMFVITRRSFSVSQRNEKG